MIQFALNQTSRARLGVLGCFSGSWLRKFRQQTRRLRHETWRIGMRVIKLCEGNPPSGCVIGEALATPRATQAAWQRKLYHGLSGQAGRLAFGAGGGSPVPFQHKQQRGALSSPA